MRIAQLDRNREILEKSRDADLKKMEMIKRKHKS
jgi:hypothetical protein